MKTIDPLNRAIRESLKKLKPAEAYAVARNDATRRAFVAQVEKQSTTPDKDTK